MTHAQRTCRRKVRYTDPRAALREFVRLAAAGQRHHTLNVYKCDECGGLHLGRAPLSPATRRRLADQERRPVIARLITRLPSHPT